MSAKPTLGYASRTEAVLALRAANLTTKQIAEKLDIGPENVTALEFSAARWGGRGRFAASFGARRAARTVLLPADVLAGLIPHAQKRGIRPDELAHRLIQAAVEGLLINAILDDGVRS